MTPKGGTVTLGINFPKNWRYLIKILGFLVNVKDEASLALTDRDRKKPW